MGRFINPFTDIGFKKIFGQEIHKDLLICFLNDLLAGEKTIEDISYQDKEVVPEYDGDRSTIFDIYCTTDKGEHFIVEMQNQPQEYFADRALYYTCRMIYKQGERGTKWNYKLVPVYGVFFMNFTLSKVLPRQFRTDFYLNDGVSLVSAFNRIRMIFLQLPLFKMTEGECKTDFERWIYILKHMEGLQRLPFQARNAVFKRLEQIMDIASLNKEEREKYDATIDAYRDQYAVMSYAKKRSMEAGWKQGLRQGLQQGKEIGMQQGKEIGMQQGIQQGMQQGIQQGMQQGKAEQNIENSRKLKALGVASDIIHQATGLSLDEIARL